MFTHKRLQSLLHMFLIIAATLLTLGIIFVYSSSSYYALEQHADAYYYMKRQLLGIILGIIGLIVARMIPLQLIQQVLTRILVLQQMLVVQAFLLLQKYLRLVMIQLP